MDSPHPEQNGDAGRHPDRRQWLIDRWPTSRRRRIATVVAVVAIVVATLIASSRLLRFVFEGSDVLAYLGLFAVCWIGAGGALVPIPGVRPISWFMIIQQGAALDPAVVALVSAFAMVLGQTSYFLAGRATRAQMEERDADASAEDDARAAPVSRRARAWARARDLTDRQIRRHGMATVFVVSALPTPLTTLTTTTAALEGMGFVRFLPASFAGFLVLCVVLVLFGQGLLLAVQSMVAFR